MRRQVLVLVTVAAAVATSPAGAQEPGPAKGTWGIEGSMSFGATLMRFRTPDKAWLLGVSAQLSEEKREATTPAGTSTSSTTSHSATLSVGHRWYRQPRGRFRSYTSLRGMLGSSSFSSRNYYVGAGAGLGGAWFFSPHVSLGGEGTLDALYQDQESTSGTGSTFSTRRIGVQLNAVRMVAAVYF